MNVKKGVKNIAYSIIGQIITMVIGIIVPRLVIMSYGSEVNGLLSSVGQVITYLSLLEAGVGAAALQSLYKPISNDDRASINSILAATHHYYRRTGIVYFAFIVLLSIGYPLVITTTLDYWFVALLIFICGVPNVINYFFQGKLKILLNATGDGYVISNLATITSCLASGAKVVLLLFGANVLFVQSIYCVVSLVQMLFIYIYVRAKYPWINVKVVPDRSALTQKNSTLIHQICSLVTNSTDVLLLSVFCSLEVASIYAVYNMIYSIIYNLSYSVNGGLQFIFGNSYCKGTKYYTGVINVYETYYLGLCSALMGITYATILPFLSIYTAGADISYIDHWIPVLFTAVELLRAMRNSSVNTISVSGRFKETRNHAIIESVINLSLSLVLVNFIGIYGVLLGTVIAFAYRNIVAMHYSNVHILGRNSLFSIKVVALNVVLTAMMMLFFNAFRFEVSGYLEWVGYASVVTVVTFVMFFVANSIASPTSFKRLSSYVRRKIARKAKGNNLEK